MTPPIVDQAKADAFAEKLVGIINNGSLALMTSVGHRTGLFDAMASLAPSTSNEIAVAANLKERYVREWLGAMVTGRIVDYDADNGTYHLPPEHAASLTRAARADNIAVFTQYRSVLGGVEDGIVDSFRNGGGVPYSEFPRFQQVMAEDSGLSIGAALVESILPLVPGLIGKLENGIDVLDIGCGSGHAINLMAQAFPRSRCVGYDFSEEAVGVARAEAGQLGITNARFAVRDVMELEASGYDLVTAFDAIHDQAQPRRVLRSISEALRSDGTFLMQDIAGSSHLHKNLDHPIAPFLYTISCMHCMTVSLALGGEGLGAMWGEEKAQELLTEAGFTRVDVKRLSFDIQNAYYVVSKV
jgi:2-polyprenyl-3-methyl-5-hydroxy-6-metoxy-1,4-benzoquinol methylase